MIRVNSYNSFLISGFLHIMIAGIVLLMLKTDYKIAKEIDISFLFNLNEKESQEQKIKSKNIHLPNKPVNKPVLSNIDKTSYSLNLKYLMMPQRLHLL